MPIAVSGAMFAAQAVDSLNLSGGLTLYLTTAQADFLRCSFVSVNHKVEEMKQHREEVINKSLLRTGFLNTGSAEGYRFEGGSGREYAGVATRTTPKTKRLGDCSQISLVTIFCDDMCVDV
jgi:hypothetical protein